MTKRIAATDRQDLQNAGWVPPHGSHGAFWRWSPLLPLGKEFVPVSLGEGGTPLLQSRQWQRVWWKDESRNPTGSHKDRALSLAAAEARALGARRLAVVSAGSTGLSCAAYAARAGLSAVVLFAEGTAAHRLVPLRALGATLVEVSADIDTVIAALTALEGQHGVRVCSTTRSANAVQAVAGRTIAFEIAADLGEVPDRLVVPVGGGGTIAAIHDGFVQLQEMGVADRLPQLIAVVPESYDTLARAIKEGISDGSFFSLPSPKGGPTVLNKLAHDHPPDGLHALAAIRQSGGRVLTVSDHEAVEAVGRMGAGEGLFVEPSSAVALVALERLSLEGTLENGSTVVLACGHGFRETAVLDADPGPIHRTAPDGVEALLAGLDR
jgi:threonine synthase